MKDKELNIEDYKEYFVLDDRTGDLFVRTDLRDHIKDLKGNKLWLLLKIMFFNGGDQEEHQKNIELFEYGATGYNQTRSQFNSMRDILMQTLIDRDGAVCRHCGTTKNLSVDHIVAIVNGGRNVLSNLQILCRSCNSKKGAK